MVNRSSQSQRVLFVCLDTLTVVAAWLAAYWIRFESGWIPITKDIPDFSLALTALPMVVIIALVSFRYVKMYEVHRLMRARRELQTVAKGAGLTALVVAVVTFARRFEYESRAVLLIFSILAFVGIMLCRRLVWLVIGRLRAKGYNQSHALIVGTGRLARRTARALTQTSWTGIQTVGYVEDDPNRHPTDLPVVGPIAELPALIDKMHIEHVFIALPMNRSADARRVFDAVSQSIVDVRLVADIPALSALSLTTTTVQGMTFIGIRESPYFGINVWVKRIMDIVISLIALFLLSPVLLTIALLVKRTSKGPVFYRQERCSLNGESFDMLKFRSMRTDAEANGPQFTASNDNRVTKVGKLLRSTNLDELPQLFNVLRGDMSLVGPRPERPVFVQKFMKTIPNYMARHAVKCGMTGWAQVNGWRGNSSLRKRIQFDLYYISHWNPLFDIRIMFLTVKHMLFSKQKHAY